MGTMRVVSDGVRLSAGHFRLGITARPLVLLGEVAIGFHVGSGGDRDHSRIVQREQEKPSLSGESRELSFLSPGWDRILLQ